MNNNENLALFILGVATLGITFLLLYALTDRNTSSIPLIDKQTEVRDVQAALTPQTRIPSLPSMDALHREVAETFEKTAEYLGRGKYNEKEHIELLERLQFYSSLSSIRPEQKKAAQDFIHDMDRLLTLKESVARQVKLAEQINLAVTDTQAHLASGKRDKDEAQILMDRIEGLYAISGLSDDQNKQLRSSLTAIKNAYKKTDRRIAGAPSKEPVRAYKPSPPTKTTVTKKTEKRPSTVIKTKVEPKVESNPIRKVTTPVQKAPAAAAAPKMTKKPSPQVVTDKFQNVMKYVARYFVVKKYSKWQHDNLAAQLNDVEKNADLLTGIDQKRLRQTIEKMDRIEEMYGEKASAK
jgi:hypothetical protein